MKASRLIVLTLLATVACARGGQNAQRDGSTARLEFVAADGSRLSEDVQAEILAVRTATARFQEQAIAVAAGWSEQFPEGCMASNRGAQGFHYLNPALVDTVVDANTPELVMYERRDDGTMELVGVEYIVPLDQWHGDTPPTLFGQPFGRNDKFGIWALHIWAFRSNSSGAFAPWNPNVRCPAAQS